MIVTVLIFAIALPVAAMFWLLDEWKRDKSRWFVKEQQYQSRIDALTESSLRQAGFTIDLNKEAREKFRSTVRSHASMPGFKSDKIATGE